MCERTPLEQNLSFNSAHREQKSEPAYPIDNGVDFNSCQSGPDVGHRLLKKVGIQKLYLGLYMSGW